MRPLHDVEVYAALQEGPPGAARDWAAARLAVVAPERFAHLPSDIGQAHVAVACGPARLIDALCEALDGPDALTAARGLASLGREGLLPDADALEARLRPHLAEGPAALWLGLALGQVGRLDADAFRLAAAAASAGPDEGWALPLLLLQRAAVGPEAELHALADAVAGELAPRIEREPHLLWPILLTLGVPPFPELGSVDPERAAAHGARAAGATADLGPAPRGGRRRRAQKLVERLLDGVPGPAAALLGALYRRRLEPPPTVVAQAAWLAHPSAAPAVQRVLDHRWSWHAPTLTEARRTVTVSDAEDIVATLETEADAGAAACLAVALRHTEAAGALGDAVIRWLVDADPDDHLADTYAAAMAWYAPDTVRDLLVDRTTRPLAFGLAEWTPTEEVLAVLLELPLPSDAEDRVSYARALASMGDAATLPLLRALADLDDPMLAAPLALGEALLGVPLR